MFSPQSAFYNLAVNLAQPLFDGFRLEGQLELAKGLQFEFLKVYCQSILAAFRDVEIALIAIADTTERERLQQVVVNTSRQAFGIAETRLREGAVDLVTVLQTQQTLFTADTNLAVARLARLQAVLSSVPGARRGLDAGRGGGAYERDAMRLLRRVFVLLFASLVIAAVVAVYYMPQWQPQAQPFAKGQRRGGMPSTDPVPVLVIGARAADVPVYLDGVGTARALNTVTVRPQVDGKLINVSFTEGQDVTKGFVLAKIDPTIYQAQYDQAVAAKAKNEAQLANARLDLERYTRLAATNAINKQQLDTQRALVNQLEAQIKADQAAIDNARAVLSYTDITAPIAGRTGIRLVNEGNLVRAQDALGLVVLTQVRPIAVFFSLPQQDLPELTRGLSESPLPIDAFGADRKSPLDRGKVLVIDNQVDQTTGTVKLKAEFPNSNLQLWPGQFVNVRVLIDTLRQVVVVPTAAIQRGPQGTFVYVVRDDSTVTVRRVTLTQQDDVQAVVRSGLEVGERVVTTGFARLAEGTQVAPASAEDAGQVTPPTRPDGTRGKRGERGERGEKGKRSPGAGGPVQ